MLSQKTKYALKALVLLADDEKAKKGPTLISSLVQRGNMPQKFLEAILLEMRNAKILHSKKGKGGGYYLYKKPEEVNLVEIIRLMDGAISLLPCVSLNYYERCDECVNEVTCGIRDAFTGVRDESLKLLSKSTLAQIVKRQRELAK